LGKENKNGIASHIFRIEKSFKSGAGVDKTSKSPLSQLKLYEL